jgi:hypothetical protein
MQENEWWAPSRAAIAFFELFMQGKIAPSAGSLYNFRS